MTHAPETVPPAAAWLGGLGLVPFLAGASAVWTLDAPLQQTAVFMLCAYAGVILSFMGAIHWGLALAQPQHPPGVSMSLSVVPALLAWAALALPPVAALGLMGAGFIGVYAMDMKAIRAGRAPGWYRRLRRPLTAVVLLCIGLAASGLLARGTA